MATITTKAIARGKIPTLKYLAIREEVADLPQIASSLTVRKSIKLATTAMPIPIVKLIAARVVIVVMVLVVTVIITVMLD